ncbi:MAG TPA: DUF2147 domain-containing protein [Mucilaginibacter sp.]|nr:DUF2147 domain-containing protein [Mucilaginibacter sp.]
MFKFLTLFFFTGLAANSLPARSNIDADRICGRWMSSGKDLIVQIYKAGDSYRGKMVWFKSDDHSKSMEEWTDKHNPDPALRNRKILGIDVISGITYNTGSETWENGKIYDAQGGRFWSAAVRLDKNGILKVTGYWHFKFIGKTMSFSRVQ